jgi:tetratricopeptide (TPR) repeat protein
MVSRAKIPRPAEVRPTSRAGRSPAPSAPAVPAAPAPAARRRRALAACGLAVATAALFAPVLGHQFVDYDDSTYVLSNRQVTAGLTSRTVAWAWTTGHEANWHPLTWMSHQLDATLFGLSPRGHHATSVLLHAANVALLFLFLERATGRAGRAAAVAALFAAHPLHVQSVAWVAERKDVLSTAFWFAASWAYVRHAEAPSAVRWSVVTLLYGAGLLSKPMLVTFPFTLLLLDVWPLARWRPGCRAALVLEKVPWIAMAVASSIVTFLVQRAGRAVGSIEQYPLAARLGNAVLSYGAYLRRTLLPTDLAVFYPHPGAHLPWGSVAAAAAVVAALCAAAVGLRRRAPWFFVGWFWFLGTLVPTLGLVQVGEQALADRYTYVPLVGVFVAAVWGVAEAMGTAAHPARRRGAPGIAVPPVAACAAATLGRELPAWRDGEALWNRALAVTRGNDTAMLNLSALYIDRGRLPEAEALLREAVRLRPDVAMNHGNLGLVLTRLGRGEEAAEHLRRALAINPAYPEAHSNLGFWLAARGRNEEAVTHFREAIRLKPDYVEPWYNWGTVLAGLGQWEEASAKLERALALKPEYGEAHANLAAVRYYQGRRDEARREIARARECGYAVPPDLLRLVPGAAEPAP